MVVSESESDDDDGWSQSLRHHQLEDFTGEIPGAAINLSPDATPLQAFHLIFPETLVHKLKRETNRYARWVCDKKGELDNNWHRTDDEEMRAYMGLLILMGVNQKN